MAEVNKKLKVALVHDYLTQFGGAERVLYVLHNLFPTAPIYTLFYDPEVGKTYFPSAIIRTSILQKFPKSLKRRFRYLAPFAIPAIENFNLQEYDLVISSAAFFAKGVITKPETVHISYCHTPTKYLWELKERNDKARRISPLALSERLVLHLFRMWDFSAAGRVDYFIANSKNTKKRIKKYYKRDAFVIYPSVGIDLIERGSRGNPKHTAEVIKRLPKEFFLIVSQLQDYKNIDVAVQAFSKLKYPLVIIGDGPARKRLKQLGGKNTYFLGHQPDNVVKLCYERCFAYIYPGKEDFGISAVEAMLFGKPVLAYRAGGVLESVVEGVSGEFFDEPHPAVLADGVRRIIQNRDKYSDIMIRQAGSRFNTDRFTEEFRRVLKRILAHEWQSQA